MNVRNWNKLLQNKKTFFDSIPTCCVIAASTSTQQNVKNNRDFNQKTYNRFKHEQIVAYPMQLIQLDWNITKLGRLSFFWNININLSPEFRFLQFRWRIPWKRCIQIWKDDSKNCWRCYFFISCILSNMNFNLQNDNSMFHEKILRHIIFFLKLQRIFLNIITWISWVFEGLLLDQIIIYWLNSDPPSNSVHFDVLWVCWLFVDQIIICWLNL